MARCHLRHVIADQAGNVVQDALVYIYQPGTTTAASGMYDDATAGNLVTSLVSNDQGEVEAWSTTPQSVDLLVTDNGQTAHYPSLVTTLTWTSFREAIDVSLAPADQGSGAVTSVNGQTGVVVLTASDVGAEDPTHKGAASGYAGLGSDGKVPIAQLPAITITTVNTVASQAAMLALPVTTGAVCIRTDLSETFILTTTDPTTLANWTQLLFAGGGISSVDGDVGPAVDLSGSYDALGLAAAALTSAEAYADAAVASVSGGLITATATGGDTDQSSTWNTQIADLSTAGGGVIDVPVPAAGYYRAQNILMASNVVLRMAPGVTFKFATGASQFAQMFRFSGGTYGTAAARIHDTGIIGGPWTIDATDSHTTTSGSTTCSGTYTINVNSTTGWGTTGTLYLADANSDEGGSGTITYTGKTATSFTGCTGGSGTFSSSTKVGGKLLRGISVWNCERFTIENCNGVGLFDGALVMPGTNGVGGLDARDGTIRDITFDDAGNANFGAIQVNAGHRLHFERIHGLCGVTLRFETDGSNGGDIEDVTALNISIDGSGGHGRCAVTLVPHGDTLRNIHVKGIRENGCTLARTNIGVDSTGYIDSVVLEGCVVHGGLSGFRVNAGASDTTLATHTTGLVFRDWEVYGCTSTGMVTIPGATYERCRVHDNGGQGMLSHLTSLNAKSTVPLLRTRYIDCRVYANAGEGFYDDSGALGMYARCYGYDDLPLRNISGEKLTANQQGVETNTTGFAATTNCTIARTTSVFRTGTASLAVTSSATGTFTAQTSGGTSGFACSPGDIITARSWVLTDTAGLVARVSIRFFNSGGSLIGSASSGGKSPLSTAYWSLLYHAATAPALTATACLTVDVLQGVASGINVYLDDLSAMTGGAVQTQTYGCLHTGPARFVGCSFANNLTDRFNGSTAQHYYSAMDDHTANASVT